MCNIVQAKIVCGVKMYRKKISHNHQSLLLTISGQGGLYFTFSCTISDVTWLRASVFCSIIRITVFSMYLSFFNHHSTSNFGADNPSNYVMWKSTLTKYATHICLKPAFHVTYIGITLQITR
ncbi:hypothetical protein CLIB1423_17S00496 [[Candida] railenensis]|uniref:Uncharacterized protein n=1 Tax=[Candida] railenensis TaxID=45579 RepID=A0A9P0VZ49_9ASCO|nr:hypothetical protein CLIB1423_17S00496 [[Candida] railenensis]